MRLLAASLLALVSNVPLAAQEPRTLEGATAGAMRVVKERVSTGDTLRVVPDSVTMYRDFVRCRDVAGSAVCTLTNNTPVRVVLVRLVGPDTAVVEERRYEMHERVCPGGPMFEFPKIVAGYWAYWRVVYRDGRWVADGPVRAMAC
jgi:hypothetical protein